MPYTNAITVNPNTKERDMEAIETRVDLGLNRENLVQTVLTVGSIMHPESARPMVRSVITAANKDIFHNSVIPNNMATLLDPM